MKPGEGGSHPSERRAVLAQDVAVAAAAGPHALGELFRNLRWVVSALLGNTPEDVEAVLSSLPDADIGRLREGLRLTAPLMRSLEPRVAVMNTLLSRLSEYPELAAMTAAYERDLSLPYLKNAWSLPDLVRGPVLHSWRARAARINLCEFSPDGSLLAAGDADGVLTVWDARTGWHLHHLAHTARAADSRRFMNPPRGVTACAFGPDGRVVVGYHDGVLRVWDLSAAPDSGPGEELVHVFEDAGNGEVHAVGVHVTDTGQTVLVSTHEGCEVRVRDWRSGRLLYVRTGPEPIALGTSPYVRVNRDGTWLALLDHEGRVNIWRLSTGAHHLTVAGGVPTRRLFWGADGALCLHDEAGRLSVHDPATGRRLSTFTGTRSSAVRVPWSDRVAFVTRGGRLRVVSAAARGDGAVAGALARLRWQTREMYQTHIADSVYRVLKRVSVAPPGRARHWTRGTSRGTPILYADGSGRWIACVREDEFTSRIGGLSYTHTISFHDALEGRRLGRTVVPNSCLLAVPASDGAWLATFTEGAVTFWGPGAEARAGLPLNETGRLTTCAGHPSDGGGLLLALGWEDGAVQLVDPARPVAAAGRGATHGPATRCSTDPRGTWIAVSHRDRAVELIDVRTGTALHAVTGRTYGHFLNFVGPTTAIAPDHTWIATADDDFTVRIWDTGTGRERAVLPQAGSPLGAGTSPAGPWLVTETEDGAVDSWDPLRGRLVRRLSAPRGNRYGFGLTDPWGTWIAVLAEHGRVRIWDPGGGLLLREVGVRAEQSGAPLATRPDGRLLLMGHTNGEATLHDIRTGATWTSGQRSAAVVAGAVHSDGLVATADEEGRLSTWHPATGTYHRSRLACGARISSCRFSPDGAWIATTDDAGTLRVWSTAPLKSRTGIRTTGALRGCTWVSDRLLCAVGDNGSYLFHWRTPGLRMA
ncbi:WD40 repeat domain-containing protein [Streptomyces sp. NPDC005760]|uniref:WD40 repeat domain-containing protein n=1 Tax=Streptomyces sp. NPDC005760 TaxID=3156718 RepID=UPI0033D87DA2